MGGGKGASPPPAPPPPPPPPAPPTQVQAVRALASRGGSTGRRTAENVRNTGAYAGFSTANTQRALKTLGGK